MTLHKDNIYSFDENTILHSYSIKIPVSYVWIFEKSELKHKNQEKICHFFTELQQQGILKYRFTPSPNLDYHLLTIANELITNTGIQIQFLKNTFKVEVMDKLKEFHESLSDWKEISKAKEFQHIKTFFRQNERQLKKAKKTKYSNIPEDDDCQILAGLIQFLSPKMKFLVSEDEHFWGYADIILNEYNIKIVKEWECDTL